MKDALLYLGAVLLPILLAGLVYRFLRVRRIGGRRAGVLELAVGNGLVLLWLLSVVFLGMESYYRFFYDETDSFGLTRTTARWLERHYDRNREEVRDSVDYEPQHAPGSPRVTFLGDSFTAGHGIDDVEERFVNRIRLVRPEWEVHALAVNGLDTVGELQLLDRFTGSGYQLDVVALVYCLNDISDVIPEWQQIANRVFAETQNESFFVKHSYFINILYYRLKAMRDPDVANYYQFVREHYEGTAWDHQRQYLLKLRELIEDRDGRLVVVTFPFLHALGPEYQYRPVHARLADFWTQQGVPHLDLLDVLQEHPSRDLVISRYDAHPNHLAHSLAADAIVRFLDTQLGSGAVSASP